MCDATKQQDRDVFQPRETPDLLLLSDPHWRYWPLSARKSAPPVRPRPELEQVIEGPRKPAPPIKPYNPKLDQVLEEGSDVSWSKTMAAVLAGVVIGLIAGLLLLVGIQ